MEEEELLNFFLSENPRSNNTLDRRRFIRYTIKCAQNCSSFNEEAFRKYGFNDNEIETYERIFSWIKETYDFLEENRH